MILNQKPYHLMELEYFLMECFTTLHFYVMMKMEWENNIAECIKGDQLKTVIILVSMKKIRILIPIL